MSEFTVGTHFTAFDPRLDELPVGARIALTNSPDGAFRIKEPDGRWFRPDVGARRTSAQLMRVAGYDLVWLPESNVETTTTTVPSPGYTVGQALDRDDYRAVPAGTLIAKEPWDRWLKESNDRWIYRGEVKNYSGTITTELLENVHVAEGTWTLAALLLDYPTADTTDEASRAIRECVACIDGVVLEEGRGHVRDGAYWQLGFTPLPDVGDKILFGSIFGLPAGSVVQAWSSDGTGWALHQSDATYLFGNDVFMATPSDSQEVTVIGLGQFTPPTYSSRNDVIKALRDKEKELRETHNWCDAVEIEMDSCGLRLETHRPLEWGETYLWDEVRFSALPAGSIIQRECGGTFHCRTNDGWVRCDLDRRSIPSGRYTIRFIPPELPF